MAFTTVVTHATGDVFPAADWNTYVRDNVAYLHGDAGQINLSNDIGLGSGTNAIGAAPGLLLDNAGAIYAAASGAGNFLIGSTVVGDTTDYRFSIASSGTLAWGPGSGARDVTLGRSAASQIRTDGQFVAAGGFIAQVVAGNNMFRNFLLAADAQPAFTILGSGAMSWGPGGSTASDLSLGRGAAGILQATGKFVESAPATTSQAAGTTFTPSLANGLVQRVNVTTTGTLTIGSPGAPPANFSGFLIVVVKAAAATTTTVAWNAIFNSTTGSPSTGGGLAYLWFYDQGTSKWVFLLASTE